MKHINTILHQLLKHIPRYRFDRVVERYEGDRRVRSLMRNWHNEFRFVICKRPSTVTQLAIFTWGSDTDPTLHACRR